MASTASSSTGKPSAAVNKFVALYSDDGCTITLGSDDDVGRPSPSPLPRSMPDTPALTHAPSQLKSLLPQAYGVARTAGDLDYPVRIKINTPLGRGGGCTAEPSLPPTIRARHRGVRSWRHPHPLRPAKRRRPDGAAVRIHHGMCDLGDARRARGVRSSAPHARLGRAGDVSGAVPVSRTGTRSTLPSLRIIVGSVASLSSGSRWSPTPTACSPRA